MDQEKKYDVFISYSRKDSAIADKICSAFDQAGITYFIDREGIGGGNEFPLELATSILNSQIFLLLGSKNSYESKYTNAEIHFAFKKKQQESILPYILDDTPLPLELEFILSTINWRNIQEHPINTVLIDDITKLLGRYESSVKPQKPIIANAVVPMESTHNEYEFVDLGLSVKWATCNLGANKPWEFGDYFRWGEVQPYQRASKSFKEKPLTLPLYADAAHVNWGIPWRMPTEQDFNELRTKCMWSWSLLHGVKGYIVLGLNGNSIFLPAAGSGQDDWIEKSIFNKLGILQHGTYWSSTSNVEKKNSSDCVCGLVIESNSYSVAREINRSLRYSIRPVCP